MADVALPDSAAPANSSPHEPDAPPLSAGSGGPAGGTDPPSDPLAVSDELKARLDKVIYSEVRVFPPPKWGNVNAPIDRIQLTKDDRVR